MPRNVHSEMHLHITWHTLHNAPVLLDAVEVQTHRYLRRRATQTDGVFVHAVGGVADHVHLAVTMPPTLNVSEWIGQLKGGCAHYINQEICNGKVLQWQTGYGVVSFGTKDIRWVIQYVNNQREHHAKGSTHERLERTERVGDPVPMNKPVETG